MIATGTSFKMDYKTDKMQGTALKFRFKNVWLV